MQCHVTAKYCRPCPLTTHVQVFSDLNSAHVHTVDSSGCIAGQGVEHIGPNEAAQLLTQVLHCITRVIGVFPAVQYHATLTGLLCNWV